MINLDQYKPVAHPYRAIFRKHNVTNATIANYLGIACTYFCTMMGGHQKTPKHIEEKLKVLVDQLEADHTENIKVPH